MTSSPSKTSRLFLICFPATLLLLMGAGLLVSLVFVQPRLLFKYQPSQIYEGSGNIRSSGFYPPEVDDDCVSYLWTGERAEIICDFSINKPMEIVFAVRSAATAGGVDAPVTMLVDGMEAGQMHPHPQGRIYQPARLVVPLPSEPSQNLKLELVCQPSVLSMNQRVVGIAISSIELDQSQTWASFADNFWLFWSLPILAMLACGLVWISWRYRLALAGYTAALVCLTGTAFMGAAFLMFSELWLIDRSIYPLWYSAMLYLGMLFGVASLVLLSVCFVKFKGYDHIKRLYETVGKEEPSEVSSLAELYRYRWIIMPAYVLAWALVLLWGWPVAGKGWRPVWLPLAAASFVMMTIPIVRQLRQGYYHAKAQPRGEPSHRDTSPRGMAGVLHRAPAWVCVLVVFVVGLSFNLWINSFFTQWLVGDAAKYDGFARAIAERGFAPDPTRMLGYPVLVSHLFELLGDGYYPLCFLLQQILTSLNGVIVFALGQAVTGQRTVALLGGLLCALCPFTAAYSCVVLTEATSIFLLTVSLYLIILIIRRPRVIAYCVLLGISVTLMTEVRMNLRLHLIVAASAFLLSRPEWRIRLKYALLFVLTVMLVHTPVMMANYESNGQTILFTQFDGVSLGLAQGTLFDHGHYFVSFTSEAPEVASLFRKSYPHTEDYLGDYFARHRWSFAKRVLSHLWDAWVQTYLFPYSFALPAYFEYRPYTSNLNCLYFVLMLAGIWYMGRMLRYAIPIVLAIGLLWASLAAVPLEPRYMLPVYPLVTFLAAFGLQRVLEQGRCFWLSRRDNRHVPSRTKAGHAWWAVPLIGILLVAVLTRLVRSDTYEHTFDRQLMNADVLLKRRSLPQYWQRALPQLIADLEAMHRLPEATRAANADHIDLCIAKVYLRLENVPMAARYLDKILERSPGHQEARRLRDDAGRRLGGQHGAGY